MKICNICNKQYKDLRQLSAHILRDHKNISKEEYYHKYNSNIGYNTGICLTCGNFTKFIDIEKGYKEFCSRICINKSEITKSRIKQTNLIKYGKSNPSYVTKFKEKRKNTIQKLYNVDHYSKTKEFKLKHFKSIYNKLLTSDRLKQLCKPNFTIEEYNGIDYNNRYEFICNICNNIFEDNLCNGHIPRCLNCFPYNYTTKSNNEVEIYNYIKSIINNNDINIICNSKYILTSNLELDIYIPKYNIAIEYNGLYWHKELTNHDNIGKDKNYHLNKTIECAKKNIQLIHIFEDEWINKQDIVKSILSCKLGNIKNKVYARKCKLKIIDNKNIINEFLFENHLQGEINSSINIGLYNNDTLVSLLCISKPRFNKNYDYEILRFCNKINTIVIGGLSKLLKYFINNYNPNNIITYIDLRYGNGKSYKTIGFKYLYRSKPNYYYIINHNRESRYKYQKHKLKSILKYYNNYLTEYENMQLNGIYRRIFDCGNDVLIWNK